VPVQKTLLKKKGGVEGGNLLDEPDHGKGLSDLQKGEFTNCRKLECRDGHPIPPEEEKEKKNSESLFPERRN